MAKFKWLVIVLLIIGAAWGTYRFYLYPASLEPAGIFAITPLEYGDVTLTGFVTKDSSPGQPGNYYLLVNSGELERQIYLAVENIDPLIGYEVRVEGFLEPSSDENVLAPIMTVYEMETF